MVVPRMTGCGLVTPLGASVVETWNQLLAGRYIATHSPAALAPDPSMARVTQLALHAGRQAIAESRWGADVLSDPRTALLVGTSRGPINRWIDGSTPPPYMGVHAVAADVARELRMGMGPRLTYSAACASSMHALVRACMMIRGGEIDRAVVIGAEASLHPLFIQCFKRLGVLPREEIGCRPFDRHRDGFLVSEAAAAVCLERTDTPNGNLGALPTIGRYVWGSDATTITSADASGTVLKHLISRVVDGQSLDMIQAHGTGTVANDHVELSAIDEVIGHASAPPVVYSHKGALGHSLGASGLLSVVLSAQMHRAGRVLPNARTNNPLPTINVIVSQAPIERTIRRSVCIAAGFGGPVAIVSLETP